MLVALAAIGKTGSMKMTDQIKAKADELELSAKWDQLIDALIKALTDAKSKGGAVAHDAKSKAETVAHDAKSKAGTVAHDAKSKAGSVAHGSKDKVENLLDKAGSAIDGRTDGKYSDKVAKAKDKTNELVDKVAKHRPDAAEPEAPTATEPEADPKATDPEA